MAKVFVAVAVLLAVLGGFVVGMALSDHGPFAPQNPPEPKIVEVTHTNTIREKPEIHNEPTVFHEIEHTIKEPCTLPDTGGQHLDRHKAH